MNNLNKPLLFGCLITFLIGIWAGLTFSTIEYKKYSNKELQLIREGFVLGWHFHESATFGNKFPYILLDDAWKLQKACLETEKTTIKDE